MHPFISQDLYVSHIALAIYVTPSSGEAIHRNRPYHGIVLNDGVGVKQYAFADGTVLKLEKDDILYLPKKSDYVVNSILDGGCYAINFDLTIEEDFTPFVLRISNVKPVQELFKDAQRAWKTKRTGYHYRCTSDLVQILSVLRSEAYSAYLPQHKASAIGPAIEYIEEQYTQKTIKVSELAHMCDISDVYFRNLFQRVYGVPPCRYIRELKLARAKELLLSGEYSVHETAVMCGYCDDSYFSREFKKVVGVAPSDYRSTMTD